MVLRDSQINGCGFCTDMQHQRRRARRGDLDAAEPGRGLAGGHGLQRRRTRRAGADGAGHRIADAAGGVTDEAWGNAAKHYDEDQLAALVFVIALINTWNRVNVIVQ
jgi:alkylhydroperoxidase family enzyme